MNLNKNTKNSKKNEIINLNPIFVIPEEKSYNIINFNSFFLYLFLILEIVIVVSIIYFFFKKEIIFVFKNLFYDNDYTEEEKKIYNNTMSNIQKLLNYPKFCKFIPNLSQGDKQILNKYFPLYENQKLMYALDDGVIYFNTEKECKEFLNIN